MIGEKFSGPALGPPVGAVPRPAFFRQEAEQKRALERMDRNVVPHWMQERSRPLRTVVGFGFKLFATLGGVCRS